jgi:hypothetical protein
VRVVLFESFDLASQGGKLAAGKGLDFEDVDGGNGVFGKDGECLLKGYFPEVSGDVGRLHKLALPELHWLTAALVLA